MCACGVGGGGQMTGVASDFTAGQEGEARTTTQITVSVSGIFSLIQSAATLTLE